MVVNAAGQASFDAPGTVSALDADRLVQEGGNPKSLNLVVLGFALAVAERMKKNPDRLFCSLADIEAAVASGSKNRPDQAVAFLKAIRSGYDAV
jgi:indolepyruvate ferredoxin oxidoreductase beta subunit